MALAGCDRARPPDPIQQAIDATPANTVGRYSFPDKVILANRTALNFSRCVVTFDQELRAELELLPAGGTATIMRSKFRPYTEPDRFYQRASLAGAMQCATADGPRTVRFGNASSEQTVIVPQAR